MNPIDLLTKDNNTLVLIAGVLISITCATLGVFTTVRKESLLSDGLAHASLAGVAIALVLSIQPFPIALAVATIMATSMVYIKRNSNISIDAIIGILFTLLFSTGLILLSISGKFDIELETYLFGDLKAIQIIDVILALIAAIVTLTVNFAFYKDLLFMTIDPEGAYIRGIKVAKLEYLLAILTSASIIISIKLVGVLLVTALLIIPATNAKLLARKFSQMMPISIAHSLISIIIGILLSESLPPGATIILVSGSLLIAVFLLKKVNPIKS